MNEFCLLFQVLVRSTFSHKMSHEWGFVGELSWGQDQKVKFIVGEVKFVVGEKVHFVGSILATGLPVLKKYVTCM